MTTIEYAVTVGDWTSVPRSLPEAREFAAFRRSIGDDAHVVTRKVTVEPWKRVTA